MKRILFLLLVNASSLSMDHTTIQVDDNVTVDSNIIINIILDSYFDENDHDMRNKVTPFIHKRLMESQSSLEDITTDTSVFVTNNSIHSIVVSSLKDIMSQQESLFNSNNNELKEKIRTAQYALVGSVITGILTTVTAVLTTYFSTHH